MRVDQAELDVIRNLLSEFCEPPEIEEWLTSPHRLLGGSTPHDCLAQGRTDDVLVLIDQLQSGAFV